MTVNTYTAAWYESFMRSIPAEVTRWEVASVARRLPLPAFRRVLDVCCGTGRHAAGLSALGYEVTGVDRRAAALAEARRGAPGSASSARTSAGSPPSAVCTTPP